MGLGHLSFLLPYLCVHGGFRHTTPSFSLLLNPPQHSLPDVFLMVIRKLEDKTRQFGLLKGLHFCLDCAQRWSWGNETLEPLESPFNCSVLLCVSVQAINHPGIQIGLQTCLLLFNEDGLLVLLDGSRKAYVGVSRVLFSPSCRNSWSPG